MGLYDYQKFLLTAPDNHYGPVEGAMIISHPLSCQRRRKEEEVLEMSFTQ